MNQLQKSLRLNALFSGLSGILLVVKNKQIAHLFDSANTAVFWITGTALILFSFLISYEIKRQNPLGVLAIIIQDFLWILASCILLIFQPFEISRTGNSMIAVVALIVLFMAVNQAKALAQTDHNSKKGRKQLSFERTFKASKQNVWKVISDVANYHVVAPNIDAVNVISGKGEGMVRSCSHGKDRWTETCSKWVEEAEYSFEVQTAVPDYPYPFKNLKGNWKMEEIDETQTKVRMVFEFEYKKKFQNWLLHPILRRKFSKTGEQLLANWQQQIEQK